MNDEADSRDGLPVSSFMQASHRNVGQQESHYEHVDVPIPVNADPTTAILLTAINQTNRLLHQHGQRINKLEKRQQSRSPQRRRHRSRSTSRSRSPRRRCRRFRSYMPSPRRRDTPSPRLVQGKQNSKSPSPAPRTCGPALERNILKKSHYRFPLEDRHYSPKIVPGKKRP